MTNKERMRLEQVVAEFEAISRTLPENRADEKPQKPMSRLTVSWLKLETRVL
jgi:hypothetical protein